MTTPRWVVFTLAMELMAGGWLSPPPLLWGPFAAPIVPLNSSVPCVWIGTFIEFYKNTIWTSLVTILRYGDIYLTLLVQTMKFFYQTNIGVQFVSNCVILEQRYHRTCPSYSGLFRSTKWIKISYIMMCHVTTNVWASPVYQSVKRERCTYLANKH